jgi:hypothetical protein
LYYSHNVQVICTLIRQYMGRKSSNYQYPCILYCVLGDFMGQYTTSHHSEYICALIIRVFFSGDPAFEQWRTWIRLTFLCRTMALYRRGTSSCRRSGSPARWRGLSLWRAVSGCATSWTRQQNSTTCCLLSLRTWSARFWTWLKRPRRHLRTPSCGPTCWRPTPSPTMRSETFSRQRSRWAAANLPSCWRT